MTTTPRDLDEILFACDLATDPVAELKKYINVPYVRFYVELATNDTWPIFDTNIEYKKYNYHKSMAGMLLLNKHTINTIVSIFLEQSGKVAEPYKVGQLRSVLEMLHSSEAEILSAILAKNLQTVFPKLTHKVLCSVL